jgi:hypothetical protein
MRSAVIIRGIAIVAALHVRAGADTAQPLGDGHNLWPPGTWLAKPTELQHFKTYDWQVDATRPLVALGDGFSLVSLSHPGDSAALVLIHAERGGVGIVGDWGDDFGGLGVQLAIEAACRVAHTERVLVRVTETNRGYWLDPGQGDCPKNAAPDDDRCHVLAFENTSHIVLGLESTRMWIVTNKSDATVELRCK